MDVKTGVSEIIGLDGTLSSTQFFHTALSFLDKWKRFNLSLPPWIWVQFPKHHFISSHNNVEGYLSLENICFNKFTEEEESNRSSTSKEESNTSHGEEELFDYATLLLGKIVAPTKDQWGEDKTHLITISKVNSLTIDGGGYIEGNGNTCPNTDGYDISNSKNIVFEDSTISVGDDCIAVNRGCSFIYATRIICGPGHGISCNMYELISIGSLGKTKDYETVEEIHVKNCTFKGTTNGARIKTWEGGSGYVRKITYENIILQDSRNPIIINQHYINKISNNGEHPSQKSHH
ncbi:hypothetical protein TanjilG_14250 [Lupinus angustifolius]|uniref:Polygalacturonase n=1 Tax=Lupinus angustifolius TaxID=3871 RepID=A0A1J7HKX5_LUPAN|nr:hypothetical protein TanjilG_14250 [Lupinus angustifolius]